MNNNHLFAIIALIAILAGGYYLVNSKPNTTTETPVVVETVRETVTNTEEPATESTETTDSTEMSIDTSENAVSFNVVGTNHAFDVKNITVKKGQTVTINFANGDGMHDWVLDEFEGARTPVIKTGEKSSITFVADTAGTFEYYCSVGNHRARGMVGTFVVTE
jgi:plastocyanin